MQNCMLKGKIHGGTVTDANVAYEGSVSIDPALMEAAGILTHEQVQIWSVTTGARLTTYAIPGAAGEICINGAAAHLIKKGEVVIIACFAWMDRSEAVKHHPDVIFLDGANRIKERRAELKSVARG